MAWTPSIQLRKGPLKQLPSTTIPSKSRLSGFFIRLLCHLTCLILILGILVRVNTFHGSTLVPEALVRHSGTRKQVLVFRTYSRIAFSRGAVEDPSQVRLTRPKTGSVDGKGAQPPQSAESPRGLNVTSSGQESKSKEASEEGILKSSLESRANRPEIAETRPPVQSKAKAAEPDGTRQAAARVDADLATGDKQAEADSSAPGPTVEEQSLPAMELPTKAATVAICLAGGLRMFELTVTHLIKNLFTPYSPADVFVFTPLDEASHKLFLLATAQQLLEKNSSWFGISPKKRDRRPWRVTGVQILAQGLLDESSREASILLRHGSPNGIQGLLQYFQLVEGCEALISRAEQVQGFRYDWVVRTRPDAFWTGPAPPLHSFDGGLYNFPEGSSWGGFNDRLAISQRAIAERTLPRLSALHDIVKLSALEKLNSESCLKRQLQAYNTPAKAFEFPFCTISLRPAGWPVPPWGVPVFNLNTSSPVSGAKCRPCNPILTGADAVRLLDMMLPESGLPWNNPRKHNAGFELCKADGPLEDGWASTFDAQAGSVAAEVRIGHGRGTEESCLKMLRRFLGSVRDYRGPTAQLLCRMKPLGSVFSALSSRQATVDDVNKVFRRVHVGGEEAADGGSINLDRWDGGSLPESVVDNIPKKCVSCLMLLTVEGMPAAMVKMPSLIELIAETGGLMVKCGGLPVRQACLIVFGHKL